MAILRYQKLPQGDGTGSSWANARAAANLATDYASAAPGDRFFVGQERHKPEIYIDQSWPQFNRPGTETDRILVCGGNLGEEGSIGLSRNEKDVQPTLKNDSRGEPWGPGKPKGSGILDINEGADYLTIENFFLQGGNDSVGAVNLDGSNTGLQLNKLNFKNVGRAVALSSSASYTDTIIRKCRAEGITRGFLRTQGTNSGWLIEDVIAIAEFADGDAIIQIFQHEDNDTNVTYRRVHARFGPSLYVPDGTTESAGGYTQGDGYNAETNTSNFLYDGCSAVGFWDGGWDVKTNNVTFYRCFAHDNKRHFRTWGVGVVFKECLMWPTQHKDMHTHNTLMHHLSRDSTQVTVNDNTYIADDGLDAFLETEGAAGGAFFRATNCTVENMPSNVPFWTGTPGLTMELTNFRINDTVFNGTFIAGSENDVTGY
ncbi:MAG: hypothetical protein AAF762_06890 [Pseudomonadota bacterium]